MNQNQGSFLGIVDRHCTLNRQAFQQNLDLLIESSFLRLGVSTIVAFLLMVMSWMAMSKTGLPFMVVSHFPSAILLICATKFRKKLGWRPSAYFDFVITIACIETIAMIYLYFLMAPELVESATTKELVFASWLLGTYKSKHIDILRSSTVTLALLGLYGYFNSDLLLELAIPIVLFAGLGFLANQMFYFAAKAQFYFISISDSSKAHAYEQMKKLVYEHQLSSMKQYEQLEHTMPVGRSRGCAISFDVQNSVEIGHTENHDFFEAILTRAHHEMMTGYNPKTLEASAYMVKEMGDGFICTIGFPFRSDGNLHQKAYELAQRFVTIFTEEVRHHLHGKEAYCSLGIAFGDISGYFPKIGLKNYDLYGDAIIKATRYESVRKELLSRKISGPGNLIILQNKVFEGLDDQSKLQLKAVELSEIKVRDDPKAEKLYYQTVSQSFELAS